MKVLFSFLLCCSCAAGSVFASEQPLNCASCHNDIRQMLPKNHVPMQDASGCLTTCHAQKSSGAFSAKMHANHASADNCENCHQYKDGKFFLSGSNKELAVWDADTYDLFKDIYSSASDKHSSSYAHMRRGISCQACHQTEPVKIEEGAMVENKTCEGCHGSQAEIAAKTIPAIREQNPHKSHQTDIKCSICHRPHSPAENYCKSCHQDFQPVMPETK